jgi:hypothetical protein
VFQGKKNSQGDINKPYIWAVSNYKEELFHAPCSTVFVTLQVIRNSCSFASGLLQDFHAPPVNKSHGSHDEVNWLFSIYVL